MICLKSVAPFTPSLPRPSTFRRHAYLRKDSSSRRTTGTRCNAAPEKTLCRRCKKYFAPGENHDGACQYHPALYTGGEVGKAVGFCRASDEAEDQMEAVLGRKGVIRFWDCCGSEDPDAPGCKSGPHVSFDEPDGTLLYVD